MEELMMLRNEVAELTRRLERMEAAREVQNVLSRYVNYHTASMQKESAQTIGNTMMPT